MKLVLMATAVLAVLVGSPAVRAEGEDLEALLARQLFIDGKYDEAAAAARPLAEQGVARAQLLMGYFHENGLGVAADPALAVAWYEKAAAQGQPQAIHNLARSYEVGDLGLAEDKARARVLYEQAAALDFGASLHNLGRMWLWGEGGPADPAIGRALLERAVSLGHPEAIADLAYVLATGDGLPADLLRARALYETAAGHRIDWAERDFAEMLELGEGGPVDLARAQDYYTRAARQGYAMAGMDLAELAWDHPDQFPDKVQAAAWCLWAEAQPPQQGGTDYTGRCDPALARLTEADRAAARNLAETIALAE
ncbi:tetratricopeptide repeat protein [Neotabrizicola sp. VNH66]|uniref:tetratricopeptide repeat protein n=1 Tax=Neotabrizicola sp. VNH66 TaxID=3400918 RepID=UPI003C0BFB7A